MLRYLIEEKFVDDFRDYCKQFRGIKKKIDFKIYLRKEEEDRKVMRMLVRSLLFFESYRFVNKLLQNILFSFKNSEYRGFGDIEENVIILFVEKKSFVQVIIE